MPANRHSAGIGRTDRDSCTRGGAATSMQAGTATSTETPATGGRNSTAAGRTWHARSEASFWSAAKDFEISRPRLASDCRRAVEARPSEGSPEQARLAPRALLSASASERAARRTGGIVKAEPWASEHRSGRPNARRHSSVRRCSNVKRQTNARRRSVDQHNSAQRHSDPQHVRVLARLRHRI